MPTILVRKSESDELEEGEWVELKEVWWSRIRNHFLWFLPLYVSLIAAFGVAFAFSWLCFGSPAGWGLETWSIEVSLSALLLNVFLGISKWMGW